jgi:hypothetical protein
MATGPMPLLKSVEIGVTFCVPSQPPSLQLRGRWRRNANRDLRIHEKLLSTRMIIWTLGSSPARPLAHTDILLIQAPVATTGNWHRSLPQFRTCLITVRAREGNSIAPFRVTSIDQPLSKHL